MYKTESIASSLWGELYRVGVSCSSVDVFSKFSYHVRFIIVAVMFSLDVCLIAITIVYYYDMGLVYEDRR